MKTNRVIALMTAMLLTFSLTACAESSAAPELDGKTEYELLEVENEILLAHNELWEKVFLSMSKNVTDDVLSSNYGDVLMSAVEGAKEQFSEEEYEKLKADAEQIRTIDKQRLKDYVCRVDKELMRKVDEALCVSLMLHT